MSSDSFNYNSCLAPVANCPDQDQYPIGVSCITTIAGEYKGHETSSTWTSAVGEFGSTVATLANTTIEQCVLAGENYTSNSAVAVSFEKSTGACYIAAELKKTLTVGFTDTANDASDSTSAARCTFVRFDGRGKPKPTSGTPAKFVTIKGNSTYTFKNDFSVQAPTLPLMLTENSGAACRDLIAKNTINQDKFKEVLTKMGDWCGEPANATKHVCTEFCHKDSNASFCKTAIPIMMIASIAVLLAIIIIFIVAYMYVPESAIIYVIVFGVFAIVAVAGWMGYEIYKFVAGNTSKGFEPDSKPSVYPGGDALLSQCSGLSECSGITQCDMINPSSGSCAWCFPDMANGVFNEGRKIEDGATCSSIGGVISRYPETCHLGDLSEPWEFWDSNARQIKNYVNILDLDTSWEYVALVVNNTPTRWTMTYPTTVHGEFTVKPSSVPPFSQTFMAASSNIWGQLNANVFFTDEVTKNLFSLNLKNPDDLLALALGALTPGRMEYKFAAELKISPLKLNTGVLEVRMFPRPPPQPLLGETADDRVYSVPNILSRVDRSRIKIEKYEASRKASKFKGGGCGCGK